MPAFLQILEFLEQLLETGPENPVLGQMGSQAIELSDSVPDILKAPVVVDVPCRKLARAVETLASP